MLTTDGSKGCFADREELLRTLQQRMLWADGAPSALLLIHGTVGIGKTALWVRGIRERLLDAAVPHAVVDFRHNSGAMSPEQTVRRVRQDLHRCSPKMRFPTLDAVWERYQEEVAGYRPRRESESGLDSWLQALLGVIPGLGGALQLGTRMGLYAVRTLEHRGGSLHGPLGAKLHRMGEEELRLSMPLALAQDIESACANPKFRGSGGRYRIAVIFDHLEQLQPQPGSDVWWIREFCEACPAALRVIVSRDLPSWTIRGHDSAMVVEAVTLSGLDAADADRHLTLRNIKEPAVRQHLLRVAGGLPAHLALAADACGAGEQLTGHAATLEDLDMDLERDIAGRLTDLLLTQLDGVAAAWMRLAAIPRWFTRDTLERLVGPRDSVEIPEFLRRIQQMSVIEPFPEIPAAYSMRQEPRRWLLSELRENVHWVEWNQVLCEYHHVCAHSGSAGRLSLHRAEELYHTLALDLQKGLDLMEKLWSGCEEEFDWSGCARLLDSLKMHLHDVRADDTGAGSYLAFYHAEMLSHGRDRAGATAAYQESLAHCGDTLRPRVLLGLAGISAHVEGSIDLYRQIIAAAPAAGDRQTRARALLCMGSSKTDIGASPDVDKNRMLDEALTIFRADGDGFWAAEALREKAIRLERQDRAGDAVPLTLEALLYAERDGRPNFIARARHAVGRVSYYAGDYDQAVTYLRQAMAGFEQLGDQGGVSSCARTIGMAFRDRQPPDYRRDAAYLNRALRIDATVLESQWGVARNLFEIGSLHRKAGSAPDIGLHQFILAAAIWGSIGHVDARRTEEAIEEIASTLGAYVASTARSAVAGDRNYGRFIG